MSRLVLHVGPAKCGSSSIQHYFTTVHYASETKKRFHLFGSFRKQNHEKRVLFDILDPVKITELNCEKPSEMTLSYVIELLNDNFRNCDIFILSHEFLFQCPLAVQNICSIAESQSITTSIIGYSRRQSDFLISAYSQWIFRATDRIKEIAGLLNDLHVDSALFSGIERYVIASIGNDFHCARQLSEFKILDWFECYHNLELLLAGHGIVIKCGVLPERRAKKTLIEDFIEKAGLEFRPNENDVTRTAHVNVSFHPDIVEAVNNGVVYGLNMPGPHDYNDILTMLSNQIGQSDDDSFEFLSHLKSYVDTYYEQSNMRLCDKYDLPKDCFIPAERILKKDILDIIANEGQKRLQDYPRRIEQYRMLSARLVELCIKLAKNG